jgi:hypothetical protein
LDALRRLGVLAEIVEREVCWFGEILMSIHFSKDLVSVVPESSFWVSNEAVDSERGLAKAVVCIFVNVTNFVG